MQTFAINITDNSDVECNETFSMAIISVTTCGVTIGSDRVSEVMIRDDDSKYLIVQKVFSTTLNFCWSFTLILILII